MNKKWMMLTGALALMVTSCIEHHAVVSLNKDGSGTVTEETSLGGAAVAMMSGLGGLGGEEGAVDPFAEMADEGAAKERAAKMGEGVTVEKVEAIDAKGRKGGKVTYAFKDINKLKYTFGDSMNDMNPEEGAEEGDAEEKPSEPIAFSYKDGVLTVKNPDAAKALEEDEEVADPAEEMDEASLAMAKQMMGDMKMSFKLEFPGGIAESDASHVDGNDVTMMEMEMGKILEDPEKFKKLNQAQPETPAEMQELLKGIEGVKVEIKDEITIKLK